MKFFTSILFAAIIATQASAIELATANSTKVTEAPTATEKNTTTAATLGTNATPTAASTGSEDTISQTGSTSHASGSITDPFNDGTPAVEEASASGSSVDGPSVGEESSSGSSDAEAGVVSAGVCAKSLTLGVSAVVVTLAAALF